MWPAADKASPIGPAPRISEYTSRIAYCFVPQLLRTLVYGDPAPTPKRTNISWINGLRGWAALCVTFCHFMTPFTELCFFSWDSERRTSWMYLPIIRLPFSGHPMVSIFFVVGGFVLSLKPLQLMNAKDESTQYQITRSLSSSVFRRWFRLHLPLIPISFIFMTITWFGLTKPMLANFHTSPQFPVYCEASLPQYPDLLAHLKHWSLDVYTLTDFWLTKNFYPAHDHHLWTIPIEFRSSIILFVSLLGLANLGNNLRFVALGFLGIYCFSHDRWGEALFLFGACSAQLEIIRHGRSESSLACKDVMPAISLQTPLFQSIYKWGSHCNSALVFFLSLWLLSSPHHEYATAPGFVFISNFIPSCLTDQPRFWPSVGAIILVNHLNLCSTHSPFRKLFTNDVAQYLGSVSFSLYLVHGPILHTFGFFVPIWIWTVLDRSSSVGYPLGLFIAAIVNIAIFLACADVFAREIEDRSIKLILWLEKKCNR